MDYQGQICDDLIRKGYAIFKVEDELAYSIDDIFLKGESFFSQTLSEKKQQSSPEILEGYRAAGIEFSETPDYPDLNDSFSVWKRNSNNKIIANWANENTLHNAMSKLFGKFTSLVHEIFETLRLKINKNGQIIEESDLDYLQINYYEPIKHDREFLQDMHEDGHLVTITRSTKPGLEMMIDGKFQPVFLKEKEALLMPGSILTLITGGIIQPLYHRVCNDRISKVRESLMFFVNLSLDHDQKAWIENETNIGLDIRKIAIDNSARFGLSKFDIIPKM